MTRSLTAPVYDASTVARLLGITYTEDQLNTFGPPPDPLDGFVTFFDPGWNILKLRTACEGKGRIFYPQSWYEPEPFAQTEDFPRYREVRGKPVLDSTRKAYAEQLKLLPEGEEVPPARVVLAALVTHFLATGERLLPDICVRCADQTSRSARVNVGYFGRGGLLVDHYWDGGRDSGFGITSSRKFP